MSEKHYINNADFLKALIDYKESSAINPDIQIGRAHV